MSELDEPRTEETTLYEGWGSADPADELAPPLLFADRFRVVRQLGSGGMGIVYLTEDETLGGRVALKTMRRLDPRERDRVKNEFRSLMRIRHPHLVHLYELHPNGEQVFFTMEHVPGVDLSRFLQMLREREDDAIGSLRRVFVGIAQGLKALHRAGLLHLDLKPANVIIGADGRAKILDFGLVRSFGGQGREARVGGICGTRRYMAPETVRGERPSDATDWFAFGRMLNEALDQLAGEISANAERSAAALRELSRELQHPEPGQRPSETVLIRLGASALVPSASEDEATLLVGREGDLEPLRAGLASARLGRPVWIDIAGRSGVGKSSLIRSFLREESCSIGTTVLRGTCYECDATPFQGVEEVMNDLAYQLVHPGEPKGAKEDIALAGVLFPSFAGSDQDLDGLQEDPLVQRQRIFSAVKRLLAKATNDKTVVIVLEDVHWADRDAARLFAELLCTPTPGSLLVLSTRLLLDEGSNLFVRETSEILDTRGSDVQRWRHELQPLSAVEIGTCLQKWGARNEGQREAIVRAASGLPFLARALCRCSWESDSVPSLTALIDRLLEGAPAGTRQVLWRICLCPFPLAQAVALEQASNDQSHEVLAALRHVALVRTCGAFPDDALEPYHVAISRAVRESIPLEEQRRVMGAVAHSLEHRALASTEQLATLLQMAGDSDRAGEFARLAAQDAEKTLAFDKAADWYACALEWANSDDAQLLAARARTLTYAGRGAAAAECYERLARRCPTEREELTMKAGTAWLAAGHVERGVATLEPLLNRAGLSVPRSGKTAALRAMWLLALLWRRGLAVHEVEKEGRDLARTIAVDACWECAKTVALRTPMQGIYLHLGALARSQELGDSVRSARSMAALSVFVAASPMESVGTDLMKRARDLAVAAGDPHLQGTVRTMQALTRLAHWDPPDEIALESESALALLRESDVATSWEEQVAFGVALKARKHLGEMDRLAREASQWLADSLDRDDLFARTLASQFVAAARIAQGRLLEAKQHADASVEGWSERAFTVQHYYDVRFKVQVDLYTGNYPAALQRLQSHWYRIVAARLLDNPISRPELLLLRGLVELRAAESGVVGNRLARWRVNRIARKLNHSRSELARAHGDLLRAAVAARDGRSETAKSELQNAVRTYQERNMKLFAACGQARLSELRGSPRERQDAWTSLGNMGIAEPENYARIHVPDVIP